MPLRTKSLKETTLIKRFVILFIFIALGAVVVAEPVDTPRPIDSRSTVFLEEMTWMEVRDALAEGKTTAIIPTGGIEQNGPYVVLGKHNYISEVVAEKIAIRLGDALVLPVVKFVPEGSFSPPSGHMRYPGTITVRKETFKLLISEICTSLKVHGFKKIVLLGDSGDNQQPLEEVAAELTFLWHGEVGEAVNVFYIKDFYNYEFLRDWLKTQGIIEKSEGTHDELAFSLQLLAIDPQLIRKEERERRGMFHLNGIELSPPEKFIKLGSQIIELRVEKTVEAILRQKSSSQEVPPQMSSQIYGEDVLGFSSKIKLKEWLTTPLKYFLNPTQRVYWLYLYTALVIALFSYHYYRKDNEQQSLKQFLSYCFPKSVYLHHSAKVDYLYYFINRTLFPLIFAPVLLSSEPVSRYLQNALAQFGVSALSFPYKILGSVTYTLLVIIAFDFGLYVSHFLLHKIPALWEFHKVHHSAEVLTPLTVYRQHPIDDFMAITFSALSVGVVDGVFRFLFPAEISKITVLQMNMFTFLFYVFGYNLRHSHIWVSYGPFWSSIFISPAQHQIHHSDNPQHFDKNIGFMLAIWDKLFGTIYIPKNKEEIRFGLPPEDTQALRTVWRLYLVPFVKAYRVLRQKR